MLSPFQLEAYKNNTFDLDTLETTLNELKYNSYDNLLEMQRNISGFDRFDFTFDQLERVNKIDGQLVDMPIRYRLIIPKDFIDVADRERYKKSPLYNKMVDQKTIASNPDMFVNNFMVFIKGQFFNNVKIVCKEDNTYFYFTISSTTPQPEDMGLELFERLKTERAPVTILYVANNEYGEMTSSKSRYNIFNGVFPYDLFTRLNFRSRRKPIAFTTTDDKFFRYNLVDATDARENINLGKPSNFTNDSVNVRYFNFAYLHEVLDLNLDNNEKFFELPLSDTPIPIENLMCFTKTTNNNYDFAHNVTFKLFYPNIYRIDGVATGRVKILVFYRDIDSDRRTNYKNDIQLYRKIAPDYLEQYKNGTIPADIRDYKPQVISYNHEDYWQSTENGDHFKYKINKLRSIYNKDNWALSTYNENLNLHDDSFYIDLRGKDLSRRVRMSTEPDMDTFVTQFKEQHYLFRFSRDFSKNPQQLRIFIDGFIYIPEEVYTTTDHMLIYIPSRLIKPTSVLEIERFYDYIFSMKDDQNINHATEDQLTHIKLPDLTTKVLVNDIFAVNRETRQFLKRNEFDILIPKGDEWIPVTPGAFLEVKEFKFKLVNDRYLNKNLHVGISKRSETVKRKIETQEDINSTFTFNYSGIDDARIYRLFANGRLLPSSKFVVDFGEVSTGLQYVYLLQEKELGDEYVIDITPYKYVQVYYLKEIPKDGVISLRGKIQRPMDLRWYDVYLNGKKLNKNDIEILTPTLIVLNHETVRSRKHFTIFQKDRFLDYFRLADIESGEDLIIKDEERKRKLIGDRPDIRDEERDILRNEIPGLEDTIKQNKFYRKEIIPLKWINPDEQQITQDMIDTYGEDFFDAKRRYFINPNGGESTKSILTIIP